VGSAPLATTITVPSHAETSVRFGLHNDGGSQASVNVDVSGPGCLGVIDLIGQHDALEPGQGFTDDLLIKPAVGCASPARLAFKTTAAGRHFDFNFDVTITP
jgi:hypothetical protein